MCERTSAGNILGTFGRGGYAMEKCHGAYHQWFATFASGHQAYHEVHPHGPRRGCPQYAAGVEAVPQELAFALPLLP